MRAPAAADRLCSVAITARPPLIMGVNVLCILVVPQDCGTAPPWRKNCRRIARRRAPAMRWTISPARYAIFEPGSQDHNRTPGGFYFTRTECSTIRTLRGG